MKKSFTTILLLATLGLSACQPSGTAVILTNTPGLPPPVKPDATQTVEYIKEVPVTGDVPDGLEVRLYSLQRSPIPEEWGYADIQTLIGEKPETGDDFQARVMEANQALQPFDYRLEIPAEVSDQERMALFHGNTSLVDDIQWFSPVSVKGDRTDFTMLIESASSGIQLVRKEGMEAGPQDSAGWRKGYPRYFGNSLISATLQRQGDQGTVKVFMDGNQIKQVDFNQAAPLDGLYGLWTDENHWYLEVADQVLIDGVSQNDRQGYSASFGFMFIHQRPFHLFVKEGRAGIYYDGQELVLPGDSVPHYACCSKAELNPQQRAGGVVFYLQSGKQWYYAAIQPSHV